MCVCVCVCVHVRSSALHLLAICPAVSFLSPYVSAGGRKYLQRKYRAEVSETDQAMSELS